MEQTDYWQIFKETGDPMCWLLFKASERRENEPECDARAEG